MHKDNTYLLVRCYFLFLVWQQFTNSNLILVPAGSNTACAVITSLMIQFYLMLLYFIGYYVMILQTPKFLLLFRVWSSMTLVLFYQFWNVWNGVMWRCQKLGPFFVQFLQKLKLLKLVDTEICSPNPMHTLKRKQFSEKARQFLT